MQISSREKLRFSKAARAIGLWDRRKAKKQQKTTKDGSYLKENNYLCRIIKIARDCIYITKQL